LIVVRWEEVSIAFLPVSEKSVWKSENRAVAQRRCCAFAVFNYVSQGWLNWRRVRYLLDFQSNSVGTKQFLPELTIKHVNETGRGDAGAPSGTAQSRF
jgi:hypothetical protein